MSRFTTLSVFPDVNVWLALSTPDHQHFAKAWTWYTDLPTDASLYFCRFTQLGLLRLLTTGSVMGQGTLNQVEAWEAYDRWLNAGHAEFAEEPTGLDAVFRSRSAGRQASPKDWADSYLASFAAAAHLTLVTFDKALASKVKGSILL
jgi:toxin-antitoxin system PIN domain toxin